MRVLTRRQFTSTLGASALTLPSLRVAAADDGFHPLRAGAAKAQLLAAGEPQTDVWAYGKSVPGPILRVRQGERLKVRFFNDLSQPSTVHWHGIRIDNAMDGVAGLTQDAVPAGKSFDYNFIAPDAGTYWYHPHSRTWEQLARGLYGMLIVEEREPPGFDLDLPLVIDDWRLTEQGAIHEASLGAMMDKSHAGRLGNWVTVNGASGPILQSAHQWHGAPAPRQCLQRPCAPAQDGQSERPGHRVGWPTSCLPRPPAVMRCSTGTVAAGRYRLSRAL